MQAEARKLAKVLDEHYSRLHGLALWSQVRVRPPITACRMLAHPFSLSAHRCKTWSARSRRKSRAAPVDEATRPRGTTLGAHPLPSNSALRPAPLEIPSTLALDTFLSAPRPSLPMYDSAVGLDLH